MALSNIVKQAVYRSAFGHFGENEQKSNLTIATRIAERMGIPVGGDRLAVFNWVRAARRLWEQGAELERETDPLKVIRPVSTDPTLSDGLAQYRYRVLVEVTEPATGEVLSNVVIVDSSVPLSQADIEADGLATLTHLRNADRIYIPIGNVSASATIELTITTAGRR